MPYELPPLGFDYDACEPHLDALTMEIHYSKHHAGYTAKLNAAIAGTEMDGLPIEQLLTQHSDVTAVRNLGGGYWNHCLYWRFISPNGGGEPTGDLSAAIENEFGSFDSFKQQFTQAAMTQFGSGWAWLIVKDDGSLAITKSLNQVNPIMDGEGTPILTVDVWEHAYYKKFGPGRGDFVAAWWNVVDWDEVSIAYHSAL